MGSLLWAAAAFCLRVGVQYVLAKRSGKPFTALDPPARQEITNDTDEDSAESVEQPWAYQDGKFF